MGSSRALFDWMITNSLSDVIKNNEGNKEGDQEDREEEAKERGREGGKVHSCSDHWEDIHIAEYART